MLWVRNFNPEIHHRRSIRLQGYDYSRPGYYFITLCCSFRECLFGEIIDNKMILNDFGRIAHEEWILSARIRSEIELDEFIVMPNHFHAIVLIRDDHHGRGDRPGVDCRGDRPGVDCRGDRPVAPTDINPRFAPTEIYPRVAPTEIYPPVAPTEIYPPVAPTDINPPVAPTDIYPRVAPTEIYPRVAPTEIYPPVAPTGPKPKSIGSLIAGYKSAVTKKINQTRNKPGENVWQRDYFEHVIRDEKSLIGIRKYIQNNPCNWNNDEFYY